MNKEQIRELVDKIIVDYKEHYDFPTQGESHMHDCITSDLREFAQLEKAPEPWGYARKYESRRMGACWELCAPEDANVTLYTYPPEVAELRKQAQDLITQNTDYLERLRDVRWHYEAASKATEQAHVDLAESQWKITDLEKQVQSLQADNEKLREKANHAEKRQGIALAKHGDGRTVQQVKDDAIAEYKRLEGDV